MYGFYSFGGTPDTPFKPASGACVNVSSSGGQRVLTVVKTAPDDVLIHDSCDYIKDFLVGRSLRDAKICEIESGTWEMQKRIIGGS